MIFGIGIDIQHISDLAEMHASRKEIFIQKVFTSDERAYCESLARPDQHYAARWAAKEAFFKAMGTGVREGLRFKQVEVVRTEAGKPELRLNGKAKEMVDQRGLQPLVSLSHSHHYAVGSVVLLKKMTSYGGTNE